MNERDVLDRLHRRYAVTSYEARRYATAAHVPQNPYGAGPIADFIVADCWQGRDQWPLLGFEIKCARSDWLRELADPAKAQAWMRYCTRWYLVTSEPGIVRDGELPAGWGHMQANSRGLLTVKAAPKLHPEPIPHWTYVALLRQTQKAALRSEVVAGSYTA